MKDLRSCWGHKWRLEVFSSELKWRKNTVKTNQHPSKKGHAWFSFDIHPFSHISTQSDKSQMFIQRLHSVFLAGWYFSSDLAYSCFTLLDLHLKQPRDRCQSWQVLILFSVSCLCLSSIQLFAFSVRCLFRHSGSPVIKAGSKSTVSQGFCEMSRKSETVMMLVLWRQIAHLYHESLCDDSRIWIRHSPV